MSKKDYVKEVHEERGILERIMGYIPGYRGYKEKELRRESDRLVRMEAVNRLKTAKTTIRRIFANPTIVQSFQMRIRTGLMRLRLVWIELLNV